VLDDLSEKVSHTVLLPMVEGSAFKNNYTSVLERAVHNKKIAALKKGQVVALKKGRRNKNNKSNTSNTNNTAVVAEPGMEGVKKYDSKNIYTALRKAANHPLLLLRLYEKNLDNIIQESHDLKLFGQNVSIRRVREYIHSAQTGNDFRLHQHCEEYQHESKLLNSLMLDKKLLTDAPKLNWLREQLPLLWSQGHRVLLFSQWTTLLDLVGILMEQLGEGGRFMRLDGQTSVDERQDMIDTFNAPNSAYRTFLLSTRAGGMGINLTSADTVILHDLDPNPTHDKQAEDRAHRIGQTKQVTVYRLVMEGTVDQHILEKSESKAKLNTSVLQDGVPDPFKDADDDGKKGNKGQRSMNSLIERALAQHGMGKE
jgi:SWI/SNF-related matrix-associated actin-dependent regulator 1 of chromatin subfamily A